MTTVKPEHAAPPAGGPEALIEEARARQRRRHRGIAVAILLAAAAGAGAAAAFGGGGAHHPPPAAADRPPPSSAASPGAIRAFVARARRALDGTFSVTYQVAVPAPAGARASTWRSEVVAAQRSRAETFYRETPSFSRVSGEHSYEVLASRSGIFSCTQASASTPWHCHSPAKPTGMSATWDLLGPYPPQALVLGLQNAAEVYTGAPSHSPSAATRPEPAHLLTRRLAGRTDRCLVFGQISHPLGSACLAPNGLIAYYNLPQRATSSAYQTVILRSYSPHVKAGTFTLPSRTAKSS